MYIKLKKKEKVPVEKWREMQYEDLSTWKGNVGFVCGHDDIIVLDIDDKQKCAELHIDPYYDTYTVKTGSGGLHFYYRVPDCPIMRIFDPRDSSHIADVQALGTYVMCPPSIHPNGNPYVVVNDMPILELTLKELKGLFKEATTSKMVEKMPYVPKDPTRDIAFTIDQVWNLSGFKRVGDQLVGPHPIHGSKTGHNLVVKDDVWWCGRHRTGGGAKEALAVDCGLVECSNVKKGCLKGMTWIQLALEARKRGLI
jgi:hypothetical protein